MLRMRRKLVCCITRDRDTSIDFDEQDRIKTYNGLKACIINNQSYENESETSRGDGFPTDSLDEDASSCSSSKDVLGSFSSKWLVKRGEVGLDEWDVSGSPQHFYAKEKPAYAIQCSDVEEMKEKFAKLLLGEDITGGCKGLSTALSLSNAITNLAASVFGELWKLEPLPQERKNKWHREMEWFLSPTNYMVELVPAKQNGINGRTLEIMTPKARADIHMNLPALQKLDSMLIETLDSMVDTEFWYSEVGSKAEGRSKSTSHSKRWWLPSPQVPILGLSESERKKLLHQGKLVHQVFKAAKSINENVLLEMPVPASIRDAFPKSGRTNLGEELYGVLTDETKSVEEIVQVLNLKSEHSVLEIVNRLEAAALAWKEKISEQVSAKSPVRTSWSFIKDPVSELDSMAALKDRTEALLQHLKTQYPNLPQTFLTVTKIQYGKDVGHSVIEAYSRVIGNLALSILSRMRDIVQEDIVSNPNSPAATCCFVGMMGRLENENQRIRHSLVDQMNKVDGQDWNSSKASPVMMTPGRSRGWCIGREGCTATSSPV